MRRHSVNTDLSRLSRKRKAVRAECQSLERRRLLTVTATLNGLGTLSVGFSGTTDSATITANSAGGRGFLVSGTGLAATSFSNVSGIDVSDGAPSEAVSVTVNNLGTDPISLLQSIVFFGIHSVNFSETQAVSALSFLANSTPITLNVPEIFTSGIQQFGSAVSLAGNVTLTSSNSGNVSFASTINGAHALVVNTGGVTSFGGAVGASTRLASITTDAAGSTSIGATINTSGAQLYQDPVTLTANSSFLSSSTAPGSIAFRSTVDGAFTFTATGASEFDGAVGGTTPLAALILTSGSSASVVKSGVTTSAGQTYTGMLVLAAGRIAPFVSTASGNVAFDGPVNGGDGPLTVNTGGITTFAGAITNVTTVSTDAAGSTRISGGSIATSGSQTFRDPVLLLSNTVLTTVRGDVSFLSTVDGAAALTLSALGNVSFNGIVGGVTPLASLTTGPDSPVTMNASAATTSGAQTYNNAVLLGANWSTTSTAGAITFNGIDGAFDLTALAQTTLAFDGDVGSFTPVKDLNVGARGSILLAGWVTTTGLQSFGSPVMLGSDARLTATLGAAVFSSTIDGAFPLTLNTSANAIILGPIGATVPLASLTLTDSMISLVSGTVITTGGQTYAGPLELDADTTLTSTAGGDVTFPSSIDATTTAFSLTVNTDGHTEFDGPVGTSHVLASLRISGLGLTIMGGGSVNTSSGQTYAEPVRLDQNAALSGGFAGTVEFDGSIDGPHFLNVVSQTVTLNGFVGVTVPLASLGVGGVFSSLACGRIITSGPQTFSALTVRLASDLSLSSTGAGNNSITIDGRTDGAHALTIAAGNGNVTFQHDVGATTPLTSLTIASANDVSTQSIIAGSITQSSGVGTSSFGGALHATGAGGISLTGNQFSLAAVNADHGSVAITDAGTAQAAGLITAAGGLTKAGAGLMQLLEGTSYPGLTDVTDGTLQFLVNETLIGGLHVGGGATASLSPAHLLATAFLTFDGTPTAPQGRFDLASGQLTLAFGNTTDPAADVRSEIIAGFDHGQWDGQGIFSSAAAASPSQLTVGYADGIDGVVPNLAPGNLRVMTTVSGDLNLDGSVNFADLLALAQHYGRSPAGWDAGDLNYDGAVGFADLLLLAQHYGHVLANLLSAAAAKLRAR